MRSATAAVEAAGDGDAKDDIAVMDLIAAGRAALLPDHE